MTKKILTTAPAGPCLLLSVYAVSLDQGWGKLCSTILICLVSVIVLGIVAEIEWNCEGTEAACEARTQPSNPGGLLPVSWVCIPGSKKHRNHFLFLSF